MIDPFGFAARAGDTMTIGRVVSAVLWLVNDHLGVPLTSSVVKHGEGGREPMGKVSTRGAFALVCGTLGGLAFLY